MTAWLDCTGNTTYVAKLRCGGAPTFRNNKNIPFIILNPILETCLQLDSLLLRNFVLQAHIDELDESHKVVVIACMFEAPLEQNRTDV